MPILYEDEYVVVINKPRGVMVHPDGHTQSETISDWFAIHYPKSKRVGEPMRLVSGEIIIRPGIVHRLDTDTTGVLILAKTDEAHAFLKRSFQEHKTKKIYLAFVYGVLKEKSGVIDFPIGRSRKDFRLRSAQRKAKGTLRDAITRWEAIASTDEHTFVRIMPETGRTHQIRVHFKAIHHPIVCDKLYAPKHTCDLGLSHLGLHAYRITFVLPDGKEIVVTAPPSEDFVSAVSSFPGATI